MPGRALGRFALSIGVLLVSHQAAAAISYGTPTFPATGVGPIAIAVADFDGDCNPDFATADFSSGTVTIRFGDGAGGFPTAHTITGLSDPESIVAGDFNGDGKIDLAVFRSGQWYVDTQRKGKADLTFSFGGVPNERALAADWSGAKAALVLFRDGEWLVSAQRDGKLSAQTAFGTKDDIPVAVWVSK